MKLYIDDIRTPKDMDWQIARSVTDAISAIAVFDFDEISLDHDISHQIIMGKSSRPFTCEENFTPVAHFLALKYKDSEKKPKIIIHTANPAGALRMAGILEGFTVERNFSEPANRLETQL